MIIDTDVLIWDLRGNQRARETIARNVPFSVSVITWMEIIQGMRDKSELRTFLRQMQLWSVTILQIDRDISSRAMFYVEEFFLSHRMELADALIGATAVQNNEILLTGNGRHYRHLPNIQLQKFNPAK